MLLCSVAQGLGCYLIPLNQAGPSRNRAACWGRDCALTLWDFVSGHTVCGVSESGSESVRAHGRDVFLCPALLPQPQRQRIGTAHQSLDQESCSQGATGPQHFHCQPELWVVWLALPPCGWFAALTLVLSNIVASILKKKKKKKRFYLRYRFLN